MSHTVYPKKYAYGFVVLCFVVVMQSFIMNSHEVFIHIHRGCFAGTGAIVRLPQCQWSKPDGYGKISQCITTTKHSKAKIVCIFLGIYCNLQTSVLQIYCPRGPSTCLVGSMVPWIIMSSWTQSPCALGPHSGGELPRSGGLQDDLEIKHHSDCFKYILKEFERLPLKFYAQYLAHTLTEKDFISNLKLWEIQDLSTF